MLVAAEAQRFCNEAAAYMEVGRMQIERHRANYFVDSHMPGKLPEAWLDNGYVKRGETLDDLAGQCGLDPAALGATAERFNGFARSGVDEDFHRGRRQYDHWFGDPTHKPSPTLGTSIGASFTFGYIAARHAASTSNFGAAGMAAAAR